MILIKLKESTHHFVKQNLVTLKDSQGMYDKLKCKECGIEGKSRMIGTVSVPKSSKAINCTGKPVIHKGRITIIKCYASSQSFRNITPGSKHDIIPAPKGEVDDRKGVWVMGVGEPVKVLNDEFKICNE